MKAIELPDATKEPAAYVRALLDTLDGRDSVDVSERTADEVRRLCAGLTAEQWDVPMADGEWSARQVVGHLLDVDLVFGFRLRLVLTEDEPAYPGYDEKGWAQLPRPEPGRLIEAFAGLRSCNLALLRQTPRDQWQRWGRHAEQGREQFQLIVAKMGGHDLAHLNQLARTVAVATTHAG